MLKARADERVNILFVEPRPEKRVRCEGALRGTGGNILEATSTASALELLRTTDVAVVVSDARATEIDGLALARAIHGQLGLVDTAVLLACDAHPSSHEGGEPHSAGHVEFYFGSLAPERLCARILVWVERFRRTRRLERLLEERSIRHEAEIQQIAYAAAHDLQEPLRTVSSFVRLLARREQTQTDPEARTFADFALDGIEHLHEKLVALKIYASVAVDGKGFTLVDCGAAFEQAVEALQPALRASGAELTRGPLPVLLAHDAQLVAMLQHLIGNAVKFSRHGVRPEIRVESELRESELHGKEWSFAVHDNGIGIEPEHSERIFLMFRRLHGRGAFPGTGVGLALCKKIAANHGGRIWVESTPGQGSVFRFTLPVAGPHGPRATRAAPSLTSKPRTPHHD